MAHKYGIYQSTSKSCVFYKQDEDGNQSTFNIFIKRAKDEDRDDIFAFIDNEQLKIDNWAPNDNPQIKDVVEAFGGWATDAPIVFEIEAHRSMGKCLSSILKKDTLS
jgi:hypothetical protein